MAGRTWYHRWKFVQLLVPSKHLKARGKVYLGVELEMIYLGTSKGWRSHHHNLYNYKLQKKNLGNIGCSCGAYGDDCRVSEDEDRASKIELDVRH